MNAAGNSSAAAALAALIELIRTLRSPSGCPWDRKQTPRTIVNYLVEEVYELVDAIDQEEADQVLEELGDVLFQVVFIAEMYSERRCFSVDEVIRRNVAKMRRRHPHVFENAGGLSPEQVRQRWHQIKSQEKKAHPATSALDSVPRQLPSLMRAYRICERVARSGVDRLDLSDILSELEKCGRQFQQAVFAKESDRVLSLLGQVLFATVRAARIAGIHPDTALKSEVDKYERRFRMLETMVAAEGKSLDSCSQSELQRLWNETAAADGP